MTPAELEQIRQDLPDYPEVNEALAVVEECEGSLEDAAALIAVRAGEPVTMGDSLLADLVSRAKQHLCKPDYKDQWSDLKDVVDVLKEFLPPPTPLVVICVMKLSEIGLRNLCEAETKS